MSISVAIDTSTKGASLALCVDDAEIDFLSSENAQGHVEECQGMLKLLLERNNVVPGDIGSVVFGSGPGSFTGLRIGAAFVQGLLLSSSATVVCSSSFCGYLPQRHVVNEELFVCCADAGRGEYFYSLYEAVADNVLSIKQAPKIGANKEILSVIDSCLDVGSVTWIYDSDTSSDRMQYGSLSERSRSVVHGNIASGLLSANQSRYFSLPEGAFQVSGQPIIEYCRPVAARTIKERRDSQG